MSVRIYLADPDIRAEQIDTIVEQLPESWMLTDEAADVHAILTENVDVSQQMLEAASSTLRLVVRLDTGSATVASDEVPVVDLPNTALVGVAEHTITLMAALSRQLLDVARRTAAQQWVSGRDEPILTDQTRYTYNWIGLEDVGTLYGKTVGLVGFGYIARAVAERLRAFGMRLLYTKRTRLSADEERRFGVQWRTLDDLLRESDFVSLHHRFQEGPDGNDEQFGAREFALMKPTAYFINTARGRLVDEEALVDALGSGAIAGAGLDVFRYEPLPADSPLLEMAGPSVILTPHVAGAPVTEAWQTIAEELIEHVRAAVEDRK